MRFGQALTEIQDSPKMMRREGWNGKNMHVYQEDMVMGAASSSKRVYPACLVMFTASGEHQMGWLASQADMSANDWETSYDFTK